MNFVGLLRALQLWCTVGAMFRGDLQTINKLSDTTVFVIDDDSKQDKKRQ